MAKTQVAIVGGGVAGLNAARLLHRAGVSFQLFEARCRLGGRILTLNERGQPDDDGFDLGPSWFWPLTHPIMGALISELGLRSFPQYADGDAIFERSVNELARRYPGLREASPSMRLVGGSAALIRALARALPGDRIHTGCSVCRMQLTDDGIVLSVQHADGRERTVAAQHLIAAVPPRILDETVDFVPALDSETRRSLRGTPTWMAPHAKLFAIYDRPFWREAGLSGTAQSMIGPMSEIHDATTASGQAALFGFIGVGARQRAAVGEAALTKACVSQLDRIFGGEAAAPRATLYKDWAADPMTATPADMDAPGHPSGRLGLVGRPWQGHLHLAGSEASPSDAGYLAGALETSNEAAAMVMKSLEGSAQS